MTTKFVKAIIPVLGLKENQVAELTDSPYLQKVIGAGWLQQVTKTEAKDALPAGPAAANAVDPDVAVVKG
jgi:hypothetical protein